jgi:hypothetical protein
MTQNCGITGFLGLVHHQVFEKELEKTVFPETGSVFVLR